MPAAPRPSPAPAPAGQISLSPRAWTILGLGFAVLVALLAVVAVTLISQRQRTVLLNKQLGALVGEATLALHGVSPVLNAQPNSATIRRRAKSAAGLVDQSRPLVAGLRAAGLPGTVTAAGQLIGALEQQGLITSALANVNTLAADVNRTGTVPRLGQLLDQVPAGAALITQLSGLLNAVQRDHLVDGAAGGLRNLARLVSLQEQSLEVQQHSLRVQQQTLDNGRSTRSIASQTLAATRQTLALARQILSIARQTLAHAASLDRKVGPVP